MRAKIIDFFKKVFGVDKDELFYDEEEYQTVKRYRIIFFTFFSIMIIFFILLIFTLVTMFCSLTSGEIGGTTPIENPEF